MAEMKIQYFPYSKKAILLEWPAEVKPDILQDILKFKDVIAKQLKPLEIISSYNAILLEFENDIDFLKDRARLKRLYKKSVNVSSARTLFHIPVSYDPEFGPDIQELSQSLGMQTEEIIQLHSDPDYLVYFIGFLPGFCYLGGLDSRLHFPRKEEPRPLVPKGSVGIAGAQTGIYPGDSPGGWQIIGNSPVRFFDPQQDPPCFARPGDQIRFYPVDRVAYESISRKVDDGQFTLKKEIIHG